MLALGTRVHHELPQTLRGIFFFFVYETSEIYTKTDFKTRVLHLQQCPALLNKVAFLAQCLSSRMSWPPVYGEIRLGPGNTVDISAHGPLLPLTYTLC